MNQKGVIIQGSARSNGNTNKIVSYVQSKTAYDVIDLNAKQIGGYDYQYKNKDDDFLPLMNHIVDNYDSIIFATPIYWYSMSGILKNFLDRITDCLKIEKQIGRKLQGKKMGMISCGSGSEIKDGFEMPFAATANYLSMHYLGATHTWIENESIPKEVESNLNDFISSKC